MTTSLPYSCERCYACDAKSIGVRDRRLEGGLVEAACERHRDNTLRAHAACCYCNGVRPSRVIDGYFAHAQCETENVL